MSCTSLLGRKDKIVEVTPTYTVIQKASGTRVIMTKTGDRIFHTSSGKAIVTANQLMLDNETMIVDGNKAADRGEYSIALAYAILVMERDAHSKTARRLVGKVDRLNPDYYQMAASQTYVGRAHLSPNYKGSEK